MNRPLSITGASLLFFFLLFSLPQCTKPLQESNALSPHPNYVPGPCPYDCHDAACKAYLNGYCGDPPPPPPPPPRTITFRGIRPGDPGGTDPIGNPERGARFIYMMSASNLAQPYFNVNYTQNFSSVMQSDDTAYGSNKVRVALIYFFLKEYLNTTISDAAIANMQLIFDQCKQSNIKVLLRFAYWANTGDPSETLGDITTHTAQLKNFMQQNEPMIYAIQAGFIGAWGEWHGTWLEGHTWEQMKVIHELMDNIPASRKLLVRETAFKNNALNAYTGSLTYNNGLSYVASQFPALTADQANRIGFHDDYFVLDQGNHPEWDYKYPDADFYQAQSQGPNTIMDAEMPITTDPDFQLIAYGSLGGWYAARRMRAFGCSTFNLFANYDYNQAAWRTQTLTPSQFRGDNTLVTDDYFLDNSGYETGRNAWQYIRDHLGYRFQLRSGQIPASATIGSTAAIDLKIKNFGFSRLINYRQAYLVLIDANNNIHEIPTGINAQDWYPVYTQNDGVFDLIKNIPIDNSYATGTYQVGLWLPDASDALKYNPAYAIKLANAGIQWWTDPSGRYMINILTTMTINPASIPNALPKQVKDQH